MCLRGGNLSNFFSAYPSNLADNTTENLSLESHSANGLFGSVLSGDTTRVREFLTEACSAGLVTDILCLPFTRN